MSTDLSRFQDAFFEESAEHLSTMEEGLLQLEQRPDDLDLLNRIFRAAHSIKGNAGMFSFTDLSGFTHHVETVLDALRNGQIAVTKPVIDLLLDARDAMKTLVNAAQGQGAADAEAVEAIRAQLVGAQHAVPLPIRDGEQGSGEPATERKRIGEILLEEGAVTPEQIAAALGKQKRLGDILVEDRAVSPQQIQQALEKQRQMEAAAANRKIEPSSIRVDTTKIDKLINLVGELVITQSMISDLGQHFEVDKLPMLLERVLQLERNTREIQERVMAVRMVPIGTVFQRFPRLVRDLGATKRKKVRLTLSGEDTELDKTVVESIGDPLTHLIRNAVDHGLEAPEDRLARGKPEEGTVALNAFHQGGTICITVDDDGRGLNREKILAKAIAQGLITSAENLSDEAVWPLIFRPGFSTAETVTDVSGRGVGMDVVKRNIESLGGTVMIQTTDGRGSRFTVKLPLTLAIIEGMSVRVGPEIYIVPLTSIIESIRPRREEMKTIVGKGELVGVRGDYLPLIRLYHVFGGAADLTDPTQAVLMIVESEGERVALMVDELLGQQQAVIKNLSQNFRKVEGIAGATILGNGQVAFIVDVRGLLTVSREESGVAA